MFFYAFITLTVTFMVGALFISNRASTFGKVRKAAILKTKLKKQKSRLSKVGVTANEG